MKLLTVREVAEMLAVSESLVYAMAESGKLATHRIGNGRGVVRFSEADLHAYLESCRQEKQARKPAPRRTRLKHLKL